MTICNEIYSRDIVNISIYDFKDVVAPLPPSVPGLTSLRLSSLGTPLATISLREYEDADMIMEATPTVKVSSIRQAKGMTYTHEISANAAYFPEKAQNLIEKSKNTDVHLIYKLIGGTYAMSYGFPESTIITHEDNVSSGRSATIKISVQSMSPLIDVQIPKST